MFKSERMDAILHILQEKKHVTVHYLAEHVYASEVTLRRDLRKMEELGLIVRSYGGVSLRVTENMSVPLVIREQNLSSVKNGHVYAIPSLADSWAIATPSCYLGVLYMSMQMYPELYSDIDYEQTVLDFYREVYDLDTTRDVLGF